MMAYIALRIAVFIVWLCPFWLLYLLSSVLACLLYHCRVRRQVVMSNLRYFLPDKSEHELTKLAKSVYRNFLDVMVVETLKFFTISQKSLYKRFKLDAKSRQLVEAAYDKQQDVILVLGHYSNWEWPLCLVSSHVQICFYKALKNKRINQYIKKNRERFGFQLESTRKSNPTHVMAKSFDRPALYALVADRLKISDKDISRSVPVNFLGKECRFLAGPAVYTCRKHALMLFVKTRRIKRGYYTCHFEVCNTHEDEDDKFSLTQTWVEKLAQQIAQQPEEWLWFWSMTRRS